MSVRAVAAPALRDPLAFAGRVEKVALESDALRGNPAGEPHVRELAVYLPPGADGGERYPVVFLLAAFTSRPEGFLDTHPWHRGVVPAYDRLVARGDAPPALLVCPDGFTRLGGSQYVNSSWHGRFADYLAEELPPFVDERYPTRPGHRAVVGKSSGGFGALHAAMHHPRTFPVCGSISGDCHFELAYGSELLGALRGLVEHDMDPVRFLETFAESPDLSGDGHAVVNTLAMAACYSPNPESPLGFDLPLDLETGARVPEVWERWLAFDPLVQVEPCADALRSLELLHLECGLRDEFHLQWGLRTLVRRLRELDVPCVHEEHPGGHRGLGERFLRLLPRLVAALA